MRPTFDNDAVEAVTIAGRQSSTASGREVCGGAAVNAPSGNDLGNLGRSKVDLTDWDGEEAGILAVPPGTALRKAIP